MRTITLPTFDLQGMMNASDQKKLSIAKELNSCCESHGFFCLSGHGIQQHILDEALEICKNFFQLPSEEKIKAIPTKKHAHTMQERGYTEKEFYGTNPIHQDAPLDFHEAFIVGRDILDEHIKNLSAEEKKYEYAPNIWPPALPEMKGKMGAYYEEIYHVATQLHGFMKYFCRFDVPDHSKSSHLLRLNYYPQVKKSCSEKQWRISEHADCCLFTILLPDSKDAEVKDVHFSGLEVFVNGQGWYRVVYKPGCLVVNCGDTLEMTTNGFCKSSFHRVPMPKPSNKVDNSRISLAYFFHAEYDINKKSVESYEKLINKSKKMA